MESYEKLQDSLNKFVAQLDIEHKVLRLKSPVELTTNEDVKDILYLIDYYKKLDYQIDGLDEVNDELAEMMNATNEASDENQMENDLQANKEDIIKIFGGDDAIVELEDMSTFVKHKFINFRYHSSLEMVLSFSSDKSEGVLELTIDDYNLSELFKVFFNEYAVKAEHFVDIVLGLIEIQNKLDNHTLRQSEVRNAFDDLEAKFTNEVEESEKVAENEPANNQDDDVSKALDESSNVVDQEDKNSDLQIVTVELGGVQRTFELPASIPPAQIIKFILNNTDKFDAEGKFVGKIKSQETKHEINKEAVPKCTCNCKACKAGNCKRCTHNRCKRTEHCRCVKYKSNDKNKVKLSPAEESKREKVRKGVDFLVNTYGIDKQKARQLILDLITKR